MIISVKTIRIFLIASLIELAVCVQDEIESDDELIFAHILFRHGSRNIIKTYPNDPWKDASYWPEGWGQLTDIGKQQHLELGAYFRRKYFNLIGNNGSYHPDKIYVQSTDVDRTIMSASYNMGGMFPLQSDQIWNQSINWMAIPVHTTPEKLDYILAGKKPCPLYEQAAKEYLASDEITSLLKSYQSTYQYVEMHSGIKCSREKTILCNPVLVLYEALLIESHKGYALPEWADKVFFPGCDLEKLTAFVLGMRAGTKLLARLKFGFLLRDILNRFTMKINATLSPPNRSLWVYSGHDKTIAGLLNAMDLFEPHIPNHASSLLFELHKSNGRYHVELFYKKSHGEDKEPLEPISIPNCGQKCPLNRWYEIYKDILPTDDFDCECRIDKTESGLDDVVLSAANNSFNLLFKLNW